jgi:dephospho-CoA kinase
MLIIGILGGVASGKSLVARQFAACGAAILDGDRAGHELLEQSEVRAAIQKRWGNEVIAADGRVNRPAIAAIVFAPTAEAPEELKFLESWLHPRIGELLTREAARLAALGTKAAVLDAPVMLKAGWDRFCDILVFVDVPREVRLARARLRGWSEEEFARREEAQESLEEKRRRADLVIDNSRTPEETRTQVEQIWNAHVAAPAAALPSAVSRRT